MRISDWSSDVCSSDLLDRAVEAGERAVQHLHAVADLDVDLQLRLGRSGRLLVARVQDSRRLALADRLRLARRTETSRHLRRVLHQAIDVVVHLPLRQHIAGEARTEGQTSERQSQTRISYAVFC